MNKKKLLVFNWKNNIETKKKALDLFSKITETEKALQKNKKNFDFVVAAPVCFLDSLDCKNKNKNIKLSGQDVFSRNTESVTGTISQLMLKNLNAKYCIVGHSDNRKTFLETNYDVSEKVSLLLKENIKPIVCVGEEKRDKMGNFSDVLKKQIIESLNSVNIEDAKNICIAYQPQWSTSNNRVNISIEDLEVSVFLIKKILKKKFGEDSEKIKIIYGGYVDEKSISDFSNLFGINGFLFEKSHLDWKDFVPVIKSL